MAYWTHMVFMLYLLADNCYWLISLSIGRSVTTSVTFQSMSDWRVTTGWRVTTTYKDYTVLLLGLYHFWPFLLKLYSDMFYAPLLPLSGLSWRNEIWTINWMHIVYIKLSNKTKKCLSNFKIDLFIYNTHIRGSWCRCFNMLKSN